MTLHLGINEVKNFFAEMFGLIDFAGFLSGSFLGQRSQSFYHLRRGWALNVGDDSDSSWALPLHCEKDHAEYTAGFQVN